MRIAILGASGNAGRAVARMLRASTAHDLLLLGRDATRLQRAVSEVERAALRGARPDLRLRPPRGRRPGRPAPGRPGVAWTGPPDRGGPPVRTDRTLGACHAGGRLRLVRPDVVRTGQVVRAARAGAPRPRPGAVSCHGRGRAPRPSGHPGALRGRPDLRAQGVGRDALRHRVEQPGVSRRRPWTSSPGRSRATIRAFCWMAHGCGAGATRVASTSARRSGRWNARRCTWRSSRRRMRRCRA